MYVCIYIYIVDPMRRARDIASVGNPDSWREPPAPQVLRPKAKRSPLSLPTPNP